MPVFAPSPAGPWSKVALGVWAVGLVFAGALVWKATRPEPPRPPRAHEPLAPAPAHPEYDDPPIRRQPFAGHEDSKGAVARANAFAFALFRASRPGNGNAVLSTTSVRSVMSMVALGARGKTRSELVAAMGLPAEDAAIVAESAGELGGVEDAQWSGTLAIGSRLYIDRGLSLREPFVTSAQRGWDASPFPLDFQHDAERSRQEINHWVAELTRGAIEELLWRGTVDERTKLTVVNAISFRDAWSEPFRSEATRRAAFQSPRALVQVPMMRSWIHASYARGATVEIVSLLYQESRFEMQLLLPNAPDGFASMVATLDVPRLQALEREMSSTTVDLSLPRFRIASTIDLRQSLETLGVRASFGNQADFGSMAEQPEGISVGAVIQQAQINVDEVGTEASAATSLGGWMGRAKPRYATMFCTRPFLFLLRGAKDGRIFFIGQVTDPSAGKD